MPQTLSSMREHFLQHLGRAKPQREMLPEKMTGDVLVTGVFKNIDETLAKIRQSGGNPVAFYARWSKGDGRDPSSPIPLINHVDEKYAGCPMVYSGMPGKSFFSHPPPKAGRIYWTTIHIPDFIHNAHKTPDIMNYIDDLVWVYNRLADEKSREAFLSVVKARWLGEVDYYQIAGYQEYEHPQVCAAAGDYVIDAGAFDGDSARRFAGRTGTAGRVYALEASLSNFEQLCLNSEKWRLANIVPYFSAVWNESGLLHFGEDGTNAAGRHIRESGKAVVPTISIDGLAEKLSIPRVDLIKFDIEGAEAEGLQGARNTICAFKPKLQVSIYHRKYDLWKLPQMIDEICPGYQFYIGHHNFYYTGTDVYAVHSSKA